MAWGIAAPISNTPCIRQCEFAKYSLSMRLRGGLLIYKDIGERPLVQRVRRCATTTSHPARHAEAHRVECVSNLEYSVSIWCAVQFLEMRCSRTHSRWRRWTG
jgi:hypothetical protein